MKQGQISQSSDGQFSTIQNSNGSSLNEDNKYEEMPVPYIEANMQMSGGKAGKAGKALTLPKPQGCLCPSKGASFTLASVRPMVL